MRTVYAIIGALLVALAGIGSFNLGVMVVDRDPPITYEGARPLSPTVEQGGTIEVEYKVFRRRVCDADVRRWLYDAADERHSVPQFTTGLELLAGRETYRRSITIPPAAAPGPAYYQVVLDYTCNPLQHVIGPMRVVSPAVRFLITAKR